MRIFGRASLGGLIVFSVLAVALNAGGWSDPGHAWIGDPKDPKLFIWYLGWFPHQLALGGNPLFTTALAYPDGVNLMWNTSVAFPALLLWPVTAALGAIVSYNLMVTAGLALSAWFGMLAARRFVDNSLFSGLAGLIYGFCPGMIAQAQRHPHVSIALFPPIALIVGHEILVRRRWSPVLVGVLAGLAAALQLLTGEEVLAVTALAALLGVAVAALVNRARLQVHVAYAATSLGVALAVFAAIAAYPLWFQLLGGPQRIAGAAQPGDTYVNDLLAFILPSQTQMLRSGAALQIVDRFTGNIPEDNAYLGLPLIVLFAIGLAAGWRRPAIRWAGLLTLLIALLSLGPHLHIAGWSSPVPLPWQAVARLPLMQTALPCRVMLLGYLGIGIVVASLCADVQRSTRRVQLAAGGALLAAFVTLAPALPLPATPDSTPAFFTSAGALAQVPADSVLLVTPFSSKNSSDAMLWQWRAGYRFRMPEGDAFTPGPYLGPRPSFLQSTLDGLDWGNPADLSASARDRAMQDLAHWEVDTIVVGPSPGRERIVSYLTGLLGRPPVDSGGVQVWWHVRGL